MNSPKSGAIISFGEEAGKKTKNLQKFLQFQLGKDGGLLLAQIVREIITIPEKEILPVPQMPECVMGVYSWRSEMLWMIDLENLLGYQSPFLYSSENLSLMTMILELEGQFLGLVVQNVNDIIEYDLEEMLERQLRESQGPSPEIFSAELLPFIQGHFTNQMNNQMILLLSAESIFDYPLWQVNDGEIIIDGEIEIR